MRFAPTSINLACLFFLLLITGHTRAASTLLIQEATLSDSSIAENQGAGAEVGTFAPATASFALSPGGEDNAFFEIIGQQLVTTAPFNFEEKASYTVVVDIVFQSQLGLDSVALAQEFIIAVEDNNDPPVITSQSELATLQNVPITLDLSNLVVEDEDEDTTYPVGFSLQIAAGANYSVSGQTITPAPGFSGMLAVPLTVNDGQDNSVPYVVNIVVENLPDFSLEKEVYEVDEDFAEPERVAVLPENTDQQVTYEIFPDEIDFATLTADNSNGIYVFSPLPDRNGEENFTITATNEQNNFFERVFTFRVNPVNDPPSFAGVAGSDQSILVGAEPVAIPNFATTIIPGPVTATDEADQALAFQLTVANPSLFAQQPAITPQGTLTYQPVDDQIGASQVSAALTDNGSDQGANTNASEPQQFNIEVFAPESTENFDLTNLTIAENQPAGAVVGNFTEDGNYFLDGGANEAAFAINDRSLVTRQSFNFEDPNQQTLEVRVQRRYGFLNARRESQTFTVTVTNVEEPPTGVTLSNSTIAEGIAVGSTVGTLAPVGGAPEVPVSFAFAAGAGGENNGQFIIEGNELKINTVPDFETASQYSVLVQAVGDGASPPQNFVITVTNVAEPPTDILLTNATIAEGETTGRTVGTLSVAGGASTVITYSLSGADAAAFALDGNTLLTNAPLNFEAKSSYAITVTATGDGSFSKDFAITVTDVEEPPTDIVLDNSTVAEGAAVGTEVGNLSALGGELVTLYELVGGEGSADNGSFTIEGSVLKTNAVFDFETKNTYSVRVRATGNGSFEKVLTIAITDQPDPPSAIQLTSATIRENQEAGTVVGALSASGGEGPYSFALAGDQGNNGSFTIEGSELRTARPFNFEATPTQEIIVRASNADGSFDQAFTITITNEEEPPTDIVLSSTTIQENQPAETTVGVLSATGGASTATFELVAGDGSADNNQFFIEGNQLKTSTSFNFESKQAYTIRIRASADGSFFKAFVITVTNVQEPPTEILLSSTTVLENRPIGSAVGELSAVGGAGNITFSLVGNNNDNANFRIEGRRLLTNTVFDRENRNTYQVRILATGDGFLVSNFTITIGNVDEAPVLSGIESTFLEYAEGDEAKTITNSLRVADPDSEELVSATVSFSNNTYVNGEDELTLSRNDFPFEWNADQGRLIIRGPLSPAQMQNALRAVQYNNLSTVNPTASTRRVSFWVNDGTSASNPQERFIRVSNSNIPPVLTDIVLSADEDNATAITRDNFANAYGGDEDGTGFLGTIFIITLPVQGSLAVSERTLTDDNIGGQGFEVDFNDNATLVYTPPENYSGTDSFQWTALDNGGEPGIAANVNINILPENDPPAISAPATLNIEENTEDPLTGISVTEPDNDSLEVTLAVDQGVLVLAESVRSGITLVTGTGEGDAELVFRGTRSSVNDVLANIFYTPTEGDATLTISVSDIPGAGGDPLTAEAAVTLVVIPQNDDPVLAAINPDVLSFTENGDPLIIADSIRVTDEENDNIVAAVVAIDSGYSSEDKLLFENTEAISATQTEGVLTLTGTASAAAYQAALRSVAFQNTSDQPETAPRTVRFEVTDATGGRSNPLTREVVVVAVEDTLQIVDLEEEPLYIAIGGAPAVVSRTVQLVDVDSETVDRMLVSLAAETYVPADDSLGIDPVGSVAAAWDATTGTLTLSGTASLAEYEQSLRTLTYFNRNEAATEGSRLLQIQGFSGETASNVVTREIQLITNIPPTIADVRIFVLSGSPYTFTAPLFQEPYTDPDNRPSPDGFTALQIVSLPRNGTLLLDGTPLTPGSVNAGLVIAAMDIPLLSYVSNQGYLGEDLFMWNAFDGAEFAENPASVTITISDLRVELGEEIEKCLNIDSVQLEAVVQGGTPPYRYIWSSNQEESITKNSSIVSVLPSETTTYVVEVTDAENISVTDSVRVTIIDCPDQELSIPSAFTPDGDGVNDVWEVGNILTYESNVVEIYDRYGHRLFRSEGYAQPWDGTYQGKELPVGTYYYTITLNDGVAHYKGSITILK